MISEIHLFDFDGTLFRSPKAPPWWAGGVWWAEPQSLDPPCVPLKPDASWWNPETVQEARASIANRNAWAVLATGRKDNRFRWRVPELLKSAGLTFDEVHLSTADTLPFKKGLLIRLLRKLPGIRKVRIWDDRAPHLSAFADMLHRFDLDVEVNHIRLRPMPVMCTPTDFAVARVASRWLREARAPFPSTIHYAGAFLTPMARQRLLGDFPPVHEQVFGDHVTMWYDPPDDFVDSLAIGKQVRFKVVGHAADERGQAVVVQPERFHVQARIPHVTVSTAAGITPRYSNELLARGFERVQGPTLTGVLDVYPRTWR